MNLRTWMFMCARQDSSTAGWYGTTHWSPLQKRA